MSNHKVLITGVTGYMGGSILHSVLNSSHYSLEEAVISVTVRRQDQADKLEALGVTPILLSDLDNTKFLRTTATEFDVVIHSTNGFHAASAKALIEGLGARKVTTGKEVHYIHNSGTSNLGSRSMSTNGNNRKDTVFSDKDDLYNYEKAREASEPYPQRTTDLAVIETGLTQNVPTYIVISPLVFGKGTGLFHTSSIQIPLLMKDAIAHGEAAYVASGSNVWDHVHAEDMGDLYALILGKILARETLRSGKEGFYFANGGRQSWLDIATGIAEAGLEIGALSTKKPKSITLQEAAQRWGRGNEQLAELAFASCSMTSGDNSRELGWEARKTEEDWKKSFLEEFKAAMET